MEEAAILALRKPSEPTLVTDLPVDGHALDLAQTAELFSDQ